MVYAMAMENVGMDLILENNNEQHLIEKSKNISITAGASTPQNVIERVEKRIRCEEA